MKILKVLEAQPIIWTIKNKKQAMKDLNFHWKFTVQFINSILQWYDWHGHRFLQPRKSFFMNMCNFTAEKIPTKVENMIKKLSWCDI